MLTFKQVEALVWIDRTGSFERAAKRLNTTQSAISKRVKELEFACQTSIFDRSRREARLTDFGRQLVEFGQQMLDLRAKIVDAGRLREVPARTLRLGVTEFTALTWLPQLVGRLRSAFPNTSIEPRVDMGRRLFEALADEEIDLAIVPNAFSGSEFAAVALASLDQLWLASPKLIPARAMPTTEDLSRYTILAQGRQSGLGLIANRWFKTEGIEASQVLVCDNLIAQLGLAVAGIGICCLPAACVRPLLKAKLLRAVPTIEAPPPVTYVAMHRGDRATEFIKTAIAIAQSECDFSKQLLLRS